MEHVFVFVFYTEVFSVNCLIAQFGQVVFPDFKTNFSEYGLLAPGTWAIWSFCSTLQLTKVSFKSNFFCPVIRASPGASKSQIGASILERTCKENLLVRIGQAKTSCVDLNISMHVTLVYQRYLLFFFLAHLSRRLKWAIAVRFRASCVVRKLFTFSTSSWKRMVEF